MPKPQGLTPAQQRERRSKIMAIGASVIFVIVLVVQAPKLLHGSKKTTAETAAPVASQSVITAGPAAARAAAAATAASSAVPSLDGQTAAPVAAPVSLPALSATGQLATFHLFPRKDPFRAQVNTDAPGASSSSSKASSSSSSPSSPSSPSKPAAPGSSPTKPASTAGSPLAGLGAPSVPRQPSPPSTKPAAKANAVTFKKKAKPKAKPKPLPPNAALISTNGKKQVVPVGVGFPQQSPLFKLVRLSVKQKLVRIGVLNGSFTGKTPTLPLEAGQKLTLADESTGSHYVVEVLKLVHVSPAQLAALEQPGQAPASATSTQPAATTTPTATTTPATTTPGTSPTAPAAPATTTPSSNLTAATRR